MTFCDKEISSENIPQLHALPTSWINVKLGQISEIKYGKGLPTKDLKGEGYPVYGANGVIGFNDEYLFEDEQLLISCRGAKSGTINFSPKKCFITNNSLIVDFSLESKQLRKTLYYFLQAANKERLVTGTAQPQVTINNAIELVLPLPPIQEQHRIVAKIEALFSELDKGIESFKTAREQLKIYRQALLKHAFSGKLTEQWRMENAGKLESAETLLKRIQTERQQRYQQQLKDWEAGGKQRSKPKAPKTLPPLTVEELAELAELPFGWAWFRLSDVSDVSGGLTKNQKRNLYSLIRPYLRVANVYANRLDLAEIHNIGVSDGELERVILEVGDLLIVEGNGSIDQIGRVAVWNGQIADCVHQNHIIKARPLNFAVSKFFLYFLMSEVGRKFIVRAASSTSGLHTLSISKVEGLFVPLCLSEEQSLVVSELDTKLSSVDQLDQTIVNALEQAEALRQSILKKAFSGQLVPQDPNDEPASVLVERIRVEQEKFTKSNATRKKV